jgi:uncharacterized membrane protein
VVITLTVAIVFGGVSALWTPWQNAVLIGWCLAALVFTVPIWLKILPANSDTTRQLATLEDDSRVAADVVLVCASVISLIGVAFELLRASDSTGTELFATTALAVLSVVLAWATVQTVFTLRYAHLWWSSHAGVDFNEDDDPDYHDFAYLAFTIGMTYQVSDTDLTTKAIRRTALRHALLSYVFGTAIIAVTINVVAGLAH